MRCEHFLGKIDGYLEETLEEDDRARFRRHFAECSECRQHAMEREPTLVFLQASRREPAPQRVAECSSAVSARVRHDRLERSLRRRMPASWLAAAAAITMVVGGSLLWLTGEQDPMDVVTQPGGAGPTIEASESPAQRPPSEQPPRVEVDMAGDGVRVYQFADEGDGATAAYYIVNPALES